MEFFEYYVISRQLTQIIWHTDFHEIFFARLSHSEIYFFPPYKLSTLNKCLINAQAHKQICKYKST